MKNNNLLDTLNQIKKGEQKKPILIEKSVSGNDIAIIGIAINLPGASNLDEFNNVLHGRTDCVSYPCKDRIEDVVNYLNFKNLNISSYKFIEAAFLPEIDKFDYPFFKISIKEAASMDPCQRLFLQTAWHTFEDAGYTKRRLRGTKTGVFIGKPCPTNYYNRVKETEPDMAIVAGPGNIESIIAGRISYMLDLNGPSFLIDSACSSSLVAVHLACRSIKNGECEMALVGGINLLIEPVRNNDGEVPDIASSTGRTRTFSDDSDGTGQGEGVIAILLKPLKKAIYDRDNIHAVIKGSACNNDGRSIGITAPSMRAQENVIVSAWKDANINPQTIGYIEAHGTGTKLGDPIEIEAITNAFSRYTKRRQFCGIGSVKTNYGHLDSAAGLIGLIKAIVSLKSGTLLPNIHFTAPNRKIDFLHSPIFIVDKLQRWEVNSEHPRRCGVSSFGLSGTNSHLVLEEAPVYPANGGSGSQDEEGYILPISAKTENALKKYIEMYIKFLYKKDTLAAADLCYTAQIGREHYSCRAAIIGDGTRDICSKLEYLRDHGLNTNHELKIFYGSNKNQSAAIQGMSNYIGLIGIALQYIRGNEVDWYACSGRKQHKIISLPAYPFEKIRCWITIPAREPTQGLNYQTAESKNDISKEVTIMQDQQIYKDGQKKILSELQAFVAGLFGMDKSDVDTELDYFELGIDSISIIQLKQEVKSRYGIDISAEQLYGDINNLNKLAGYIREKQPAVSGIEVPATIGSMPERAIMHSAPADKQHTTVRSLENNADSGSLKERIISAQLEIMRQQLELLGDGAAASDTENDILVHKPAVKTVTAVAKGDQNDQDRFLQKFIVKSNSDMTDEQKLYLKQLEDKYTQKTAASKHLAQKYRANWANGRAVQGFSRTWKEMIYPILISEAKGSKIRDVDGNEYIDFAMGFGANLFGYGNESISSAVLKQLKSGSVLGALTSLPGEVAQLISELTGVERVAFANSGTEAVMNLIRIARATAGKDKIAVFSGSFHGTFDGVYVLRDNSIPERAVPLCLGTPDNMVEDVIILDYGDEKSLELIKAYSGELAAVLVEPVQSRNPDLQPREFLHQLRRLTSELGIALIFDEVITGFRIHPGGAQAYFNIEADLVAYGKILGGGLPIGVFAGKSKYMDRVDGGMWNYGDSSIPSGFLTHTGGTFCHHPLAMAAAREVLSIIKSNGSKIQDRLNQKAEQLAQYLNRFFEESNIPLSIARFASLFIFNSSKEPLLVRFLYYKLIEKGFYLWEGATCFISTAHSDCDIAAFAKAVQDSCYELSEHGCFKFDIKKECITINYVNQNLFNKTKKKVRLTENQFRLWALCQKDKDISAAFNEKSIITLQGDIKLHLLKQAVDKILTRHEILRTTKIDNEYLYIQRDMEFEIYCYQYIEGNADNAELWSKEIINREISHAFDLHNGPLFRISLISRQEGKHLLCVVAHHLIMDGWSMNIFMQEFAKIYDNTSQGIPLKLQEPMQFSDYVNMIQNYPSTDEGQEAISYWASKFKNIVPAVSLSTNPFIDEKKQNCGSMKKFMISPTETAILKNLSRQLGVSLFMTLLGAYAILLHKLTSRRDIVIGIPFSGQLKLEAECLIGNCISTIPIYIHISEEFTCTELLEGIKNEMLSAAKHQIFSYSDVISKLNSDMAEYAIPGLNIAFNMDKTLNNNSSGIAEEESGSYGAEGQKSKYELFMDIVENDNKLDLTLSYNKSIICDEIAGIWINYYNAILSGIAENPMEQIKNVFLEKVKQDV